MMKILILQKKQNLKLKVFQVLYITPIVFIKEFYASASFIGVIVFYFVLMFTDQLYAATILGIVVTTSLRLVAMKYNWNLPKVRGST